MGARIVERTDWATWTCTIAEKVKSSLAMSLDAADLKLLINSPLTGLCVFSFHR